MLYSWRPVERFTEQFSRTIMFDSIVLSRTSAKFSRTSSKKITERWQKTLGCQNCILLLRKNFLQENQFSWRVWILLVFLRSSSEIFLDFRWKIGAWGLLTLHSFFGQKQFDKNFYLWEIKVWFFSSDFCHVFLHGLSKAPFTCPEEHYEEFCWIFSIFNFGLWAQNFTTLVSKALALFSKPHSICWEDDHLWKIKSFFGFFVVPQIFADLWRNCFSFLAENYRQVC